MIDIGRSIRPRALELFSELCGEVAGVEEAGLRIDARLLLEGGNAQRAVDQEERGDGGRQEPWVPRPDGGERDAERGEDEVGREALGREEARLAEAVPAREVKHRREQDVVQRDEDDGSCEPGQRKRDVRVQVPAFHEIHRPPRRQPVQRVVGDVESLDVPGIANLEPFGNVLDDAHEGDELGREQHGRRDKEDDRRVVRLVPRRPYDEELGDSGARSEDEEGRPAVRSGLQVRKRNQSRGDCDGCDREEIGLGLARERFLGRFGPATALCCAKFARNCAHLCHPRGRRAPFGAPFHANAWGRRAIAARYDLQEGAASPV